MKSFIRKMALSAIVTMGTMAATNAAPIVTNGSFENGLTGWTQSGFGATPGIGVTVVTTGGTNTTGYGDNVPSYAGTHAAYFVDDNAMQSLSQRVTLTAGVLYKLSFALFATISGNQNPYGFELIDSIGSMINFQGNNSIVGTQVPVGVWTTYDYTFTVPITSNLYLLDFTFLSGATPAKDVLLDAVSITAAPIPAGIALMGTGLLGLLGLRRRWSAKRLPGLFPVSF